MMVDATPEDHVTVASVSQRLYHVGENDKIPLLIGLLRQMDVTRTIIFFNTKREAERVDAWLAGNGFVAGMLTGDVPQKKRLSLLARFTSGDLPILLATDVAARGLHIPNVSHVFNYDLPQDAEDYVHRVGRTARVGAKGDAVSFSCERFCYSLTEIEAFIGQSIPAEVASAGVDGRPWSARATAPATTGEAGAGAVVEAAPARRAAARDVGPGRGVRERGCPGGTRSAGRRGALEDRDGRRRVAPWSRCRRA